MTQGGRFSYFGGPLGLITFLAAGLGGVGFSGASTGAGGGGGEAGAGSGFAIGPG